MRAQGDDTVYRNILLTIAAVAVLIGAAAYAYATIDHHMSERNEYSAQKEARKQCANNIPDENSSTEYIGMSGYTNYTNYPKFDRCLADKGF